MRTRPRQPPPRHRRGLRPAPLQTPHYPRCWALRSRELALHGHYLVKGLDPAAAGEVEPLVQETWRAITGAWRVEVAELRSPGAALGYLGLHHRKPEQAPPAEWPGMTERASRGYWHRPGVSLKPSNQRVDRATGKPVAGRYEFTYRDATGRQVWQTAKGDTKADAKAERAEMVSRLHRGERVERTSMTVGEVARLWLERGTGQKGRWAPSTLEGYERIVRLHIERSTDPNQKPLAVVKLRDLSMDRVAAWSQANERALAPTTACDRADRAEPNLPVRRPPRLAR